MNIFSGGYRLTIFLMLYFSLCVHHVAPAGTDTNMYMVRTNKGLVTGVNQGQTIRFYGIPYATAQRFQYPSPDVPAWTDVMNASTPGPQCYQQCVNQAANLFCMAQMDENCLSLNVFRPAYATSPDHVFPVIVYIHGGDFTSGSGSAAIYDGDYLSSRGHVIVVTFNYRLGAFGFLSIFDKYGDAVGNFGFRDQQVALAWVKTNIRAFNGDPDKITVIGDGAGCVSLVSHLASPISQPHFHSAILQGCPLGLPYRNASEAKLQAQAFAQAVGCTDNDLACYRSKTSQQILDAQLAVGSDSYTHNMLITFYPWGPTLDNHVIFYNPLDVFKDLSRFDRKPVILGVTADESVGLVYKKYPLSLSAEYFRSIMDTVPNFNIDSIAPTAADNREFLVRFMNTAIFACPTVFAAGQLEQKQRDDPEMQNSNPEVWLYEFTMPASLPNSMTRQQQLVASALWSEISDTDVLCQRRSCNGYDVRALFNSASLPVLERLKLEGLSRQMVKYWANFARTSNVNGRITSRSQLRTLQVHTALRPESAGWNVWNRPRSLRINVQANTPQGPAVVAVPQSTLRSALATFTFWPSYSRTDMEGGDRESTLLLREPRLEVRRNYWQQQCAA